jgi:hypothetical protein
LPLRAPRVSAGEIRDVMQVLPEDIRAIGRR